MSRAEMRRQKRETEKSKNMRRVFYFLTERN